MVPSIVVSASLSSPLFGLIRMWLDRSHREFFWLLVRRDLKVRYAGSTLGGLWNLIHPLMMIAVYMTIFSSIMRDKAGVVAAGLVDYGTLNYGVHLCAGLIPWLAFSDVLLRSVATLVENANFLKKVSFPPIVLFASVLFNALLINGAGYLCFLGILVLLGHAPPLAALGGLVTMALLGVAGMGLGLILAGMNVFFRDTAQVLAIAMQFLFWFNPIVYPKERFFGKSISDPQTSGFVSLGRWILTLNPVERFITSTQSLFGIVSIPPSGFDWTVVALFPVLCLALGLFLFRRMLPDARDCL